MRTPCLYTGLVHEYAFKDSKFGHLLSNNASHEMIHKSVAQKISEELKQETKRAIFSADYIHSYLFSVDTPEDFGEKLRFLQRYNDWIAKTAKHDSNTDKAGAEFFSYFEPVFIQICKIHPSSKNDPDKGAAFSAFANMYLSFIHTPPITRYALPILIAQKTPVLQVIKHANAQQLPKVLTNLHKLHDFLLNEKYLKDYPTECVFQALNETIPHDLHDFNSFIENITAKFSLISSTRAKANKKAFHQKILEHVLLQEMHNHTAGARSQQVKELSNEILQSYFKKTDEKLTPDAILYAKIIAGNASRLLHPDLNLNNQDIVVRLKKTELGLFDDLTQIKNKESIDKATQKLIEQVDKELSAVSQNHQSNTAQTLVNYFTENPLRLLEIIPLLLEGLNESTNNDIQSQHIKTLREQIIEFEKYNILLKEQLQTLQPIILIAAPFASLITDVAIDKAEPLIKTFLNTAKDLFNHNTSSKSPVNNPILASALQNASLRPIADKCEQIHQLWLENQQRNMGRIAKLEKDIASFQKTSHNQNRLQSLQEELKKLKSNPAQLSYATREKMRSILSYADNILTNAPKYLSYVRLLLKPFLSIGSTALSIMGSKALAFTATTFVSYALKKSGKMNDAQVAAITNGITPLLKTASLIIEKVLNNHDLKGFLTKIEKLDSLLRSDTDVSADEFEKALVAPVNQLIAEIEDKYVPAIIYVFNNLQNLNKGV
jgi:hypothetical protein